MNRRMIYDSPGGSWDDLTPGIRLGVRNRDGEVFEITRIEDLNGADEFVLYSLWEDDEDGRVSRGRGARVSAEELDRDYAPITALAAFTNFSPPPTPTKFRGNPNRVTWEGFSKEGQKEVPPRVGDAVYDRVSLEMGKIVRIETLGEGLDFSVEMMGREAPGKIVRTKSMFAFVEKWGPAGPVIRFTPAALEKARGTGVLIPEPE